MAEGLAGSQGRLGAMLEGQVVEQPLLKLANEHSPADRLPPDDTQHKTCLDCCRDFRRGCDSSDYMNKLQTKCTVMAA